jgi:hypothetical protein
MRIKVALGASLALIAIVFAVTLSHAPATLAKERPVPPESKLVFTESDARACQRGEVLPRDTSAIRLGLFADSSPDVSVQVFAGSHRIAAGTLGRGWSGEGATVPVNEIPHTVAPVKVCFGLKSVVGKVQILGRNTPKAEATTSEGAPLSGRISIEYLQPGHRSWWSLATSVARRLGLGHAVSGAWDALLVIVLTGMVLTLSSWLVVKELR